MPGDLGRDRYHILEQIGRGGMGEVCLAEDHVLDRQVALKFLTSSEDEVALEQLLTEARAAAALDHPFICAIYDISTINHRPCIAMEYVRGETLERRLRRGPLALEEGLRVAEEIAEALEAAHKRRVIHRDLKPANVMLTADRHIKVMDFGLATKLPAGDEHDGAAGAGVPDADVPVLGTPAYMAPEQIQGDSTDRRSDIFSFGILLYQVFSGLHPFLRTGVDATLAAILRDRVVALHERQPSIPASLSGVVSRMLAKDPTERYQSFSDVRTDLRRLAAAAHVGDAVPPASIVPEPAATSAAALVGRDAERAQLLQCITQAASGRGSFIVLSGDAGIGKTRLIEDAMDAARRRGCQALIGRCNEQDGTPPLVAYIDVLEAASRLMPAAAFQQAMCATAPELVKLLPELRRLFPDMSPPLELPPELRQRFLFTNVRDFFARCSQFAPLVLVIDDMQWADESTLKLTQYLVQQFVTLPIVIIAAYRDADAAPAAAKGKLHQIFERVRGQGRDTLTPQSIKAALDQLVGQGLGRLLTLRPLNESDVRMMLATLAAAEPPAPIVRAFFERTGGNPFFVTELLRQLIDEGRLLDTNGRWRRDAAIDTITIPETVRIVLERRLQRVTNETQQVLRAAAVIGADFELELLEAVAGVDEDTLMSALDEAEQARLLKGPSGRQDVTWRFAHQLIGQSLADALPTMRRQRLHARIADAMTRLATPARPYTLEIAHHLYNAARMADASRTARALVTAGDAAHSVYATDEAVQHYRHALEVTSALAGDATLDTTRRTVEERLADLLALVGDRSGALELYDRLISVYATSAARIDEARLTRKSGALHWQAGDRTRASACYQRALEALAPSPDDIEAAHLYHELGLAAFRRGDNRQAVEWSERALKTANAALADGGITAAVRKEATTALAYATNTIGVALARSGNLVAARERIERSVQAARDLGLLEVACRGYANLGVLYSTVEPQRAIEVSLTGLELASKIGAASLQSYIYANLAASYCALTDRCETEGLEAAHAAADLDRQLGQMDHLAVPLVVIAQIHQCRGELEQAQTNYLEALALAEQAGEPQLVLPCYDGLATIALDRGDRVRAAAYMEKARTLAERTGLDPDSLLLLPFLS